jgi:hypothetical protein
MRSDDEPFIRYVTVFRSRLGLANLALDLTTLGRMPEKAFRRRLLQVLENRVDVDITQEQNMFVLEYLFEKGLMSAKPRGSGRYKGFALQKTGDMWHAQRDGVAQTILPVAQTDLWLSDPRVASTIGAPTPDNVEEVVSAATRLHVIDPSKFAWTTIGQAIVALRSRETPQSSESAQNPFIIGTDGAMLLRSLLDEDGRMMRPFIDFILACGSTVKRDTVADAMPEITRTALDSGWPTPIRGAALKNGRETLEALVGAPGGGTGPGVREHRASPRMEWLADLGYLSKTGLPRNSFEYHVMPQLGDLAASLHRLRPADSDWPFEVALDAWRTNSHWRSERESSQYASVNAAFSAAYRMLKRPIGPASLRDVAFLTGMFYGEWASSMVVSNSIKLVQSIPGGSLTGGRFGRTAENIYVPDEALLRMPAIE